jgi:hypothetical protein
MGGRAPAKVDFVGSGLRLSAERPEANQTAARRTKPWPRAPAYRFAGKSSGGG